MIFRDLQNEISAEVIKLDEGHFMVRLAHECNDETYAMVFYDNEADAVQYCKDFCGVDREADCSV